MSAQQWLPFAMTLAVSIAGRVTDEVSGAAIAGATIEVVDGPPAFEKKRQTLANDPEWERKAERLDRTTSHSDGIFFLSKLPPGMYRLRVTPPPPSSRYETVETRQIEVAETRDERGRIQLDPADVALSPTRIHGQVTRGDSGDAVVGARVRLVGDYRVVRTDSQGRYALTDLVASSPTLEVSAVQFKPVRREVSLQAGQNLNVDVVLEPA
jgi:hypothetical protein